MYATIDLPGGQNFQYKHFNLRGKALKQAVSEWKKEWLNKVGRTQETISAAAQGLLLSDKQAKMEKYQDNTGIFTDDDFEDLI